MSYPFPENVNRLPIHEERPREKSIANRVTPPVALGMANSELQISKKRKRGERACQPVGSASGGRIGVSPWWMRFLR